MAMNRVQFQRGVMAEFLKHYGTVEQCHAVLVASRWPTGFVALRGNAAQHLRPRWPTALAVPSVPIPDHGHRRYDFPSDETATDALVSGYAPADPGEEQRRCTGTHAPSGRDLQDRLADEAQVAASHD